MVDGICKCRVGTVEIFLINLRNKVGHFKITEKNYICNNIRCSQCLLCWACNLGCDHCRLINIWQRKELQHFANSIKCMMNFPLLQYQMCHLMDKMKIITMVCLYKIHLMYLFIDQLPWMLVMLHKNLCWKNYYISRRL